MDLCSSKLAVQGATVNGKKFILVAVVSLLTLTPKLCLGIESSYIFRRKEEIVKVFLPLSFAYLGFPNGNSLALTLLS